MKKLYTSLDSILDTRLGTLIHIDPKFAFDVSSNEKYYNRITDDFQTLEYGLLDKKLYNRIYDLHKNDILKISIMTKMHRFIFELLNTIAINNIDGPDKAMLEVVVNIFPFKLSSQETEVLQKSTSVILNNIFNISVINIDEKTLTPTAAHSQYFGMIMYDYTNWLELHQEELKLSKVNDLLLYAPRLNFIREMNDEEKKVFKDKAIDEFDFMQMTLCKFIQMQYLPIDLYCAHTPLNK